MPLPRPRPRTILFPTSLLLTLLSSTLWLRSYYYWDLAQYFPRPGWAYSLQSSAGDFGLTSSAELDFGITWHYDPDPAPPNRPFEWGRFRFDFSSYPAWTVTVPYYLPTLLSAAATLHFRPRRQPLPPTLCPHCHYDLRTQLQHQRTDPPNPIKCPECGNSP